ncbi:unnamed protein product [Acanthosepion pharaonis]|uniref:Coiled-coil domain-containing protein 112 n=1 Tax=Acanthosepion pharaonis TaxID=158019 RepID=A0A812EKE7_ACAPH|nr:unnamed protein product [Sepia pharaonis]
MASESHEAIQQWREKVEESKKAELKKELRKLCTQYQAIQRDRDALLFSRKCSFRKEFLPLEEEEKKLNEDLKVEKTRLNHHLTKIKDMVARFRKELNNVRPSPEFVIKLKEIMEEAETEINEFKENQRKHFEVLIKEEKSAFLEIQALEKKYETWSKVEQQVQGTQPVSTGTKKPLSSARDVTVDLPPEVANFDKFVQQNGGLCGGWDVYDHETFLKFYVRYKQKAVFLSHVVPALPGKSEDDVYVHIDWYEHYLDLNEAKKEAIQKWRKSKLEEKKQKLNSPEEKWDAQEKAKQTDIQKKLEKEREEKLIQLKKWKMEQAEKKGIKEEQKLQEKMAEERKKEKEMKKMLEIREYVKKYKEAKEEKAVVMKQQKEMEEMMEMEAKRKLAAITLPKFREMDRHKMMVKALKEKCKEDIAKQKEKRLENLKKQVEVVVQRDPNRLYQPTAGWKERLKDNTTNNAGGPLLHMPHRAIPSWRVGLS